MSVNFHNICMYWCLISYSYIRLNNYVPSLLFMFGFDVSSWSMISPFIHLMKHFEVVLIIRDYTLWLMHGEVKPFLSKWIWNILCLQGEGFSSVCVVHDIQLAPLRIPIFLWENYQRNLVLFFFWDSSFLLSWTLICIESWMIYSTFYNNSQLN